MYRKIKDFERDWSYETEQTVKLFNELTDESLSQKLLKMEEHLAFGVAFGNYDGRNAQTCRLKN